jgi:hypothetical protein
MSGVVGPSGRPRPWPPLGALGDFDQELLVGLKLLAQVPLQLTVDLADAAPRDSEDRTDLAQRQVVHVQQHGDLATAFRQASVRAEETVLGPLADGGCLRIGRISASSPPGDEVFGLTASRYLRTFR